MPVTRVDPRPLGVVYTPPEVARAMTDLALAPFVENATSAELLALRICDPAAGTGAFLVEIVDALAAHLVAADEREGRTTSLASARQRIARTCIVGVDIDAHALGIARNRLGIVEDFSRGIAETSHVGVDDPSTARLHVGDALSLDWRATFPDIFSRGGFDIVLANPPYIRQERLAAKSALETYEVYDGVADLYVYFVELAHRLLRPRGRYCLIIPSKWMTVAYGRPLRTYLSRENTVDGLVDFSQHSLFADADAFPCIVWGSAQKGDRPLSASRAAPSAPVARALTTSTTVDSAMHTTVDRERWTSEPWHIDTPRESAVLDRLARLPTLGELVGARWSRGVVTGLNEAFVVDRAQRDALVAADPACADALRPFVKGRDLRPYRALDAGRWLLLVDRGTPLASVPSPIRDHLVRFRDRLEPKPPEHVGAWAGRKPGPYAWHELQDPVVPLAKSRAPRLFYQDIQTAPACSFDPAGDFVPDTTVWTLPSDDRVLLAILNSRFYGWYAQRRFPPALNGAVRPKLAYMQRLPLPVVSADVRREIEALVDRRLAERAVDRTPTSDAIDVRIEDLVATAYELSAVERALIRGE